MPGKPKEVQCIDCGVKFVVKYPTYRWHIKNGSPFRCESCLNKFYSKRSKSTFANMSDEKKKARSEKITAANNRRWANRTEEGEAARIEKYRATMASKSEEERKERNRSISNSQKKRYSRMGKDNRDLNKSQLRQANESWYTNASNEQLSSRKAKISTSQRKRLANLNNDELNEWRSNLSESRKHYINSTPSERFVEIYGKRNARVKSRSNPSYIRSKPEQWFETRFNELFKSYRFEAEVRMTNGDLYHKWDYGIYRDNELMMLVDLDGEYFHADCENEYECTGRNGLGRSHELNDAERGLSLTDIPHMIIPWKMRTESLTDMQELIGKPYGYFIQWMYRHLRLQPFPYPSYTNTELMRSWNNVKGLLSGPITNPDMLRIDTYNWDNQFGMHLVYHFYHSIWHDSIPGKLCPHDAYMDSNILMDMVMTHKILHVRNRNKITQCFLLSDAAPRVPIFTPIMGMKVIHKYCDEYDVIADCNTCYGGVLLASLAMGKKYIGYDSDLAHYNESNKLIQWFPRVGINVDAKMLDHAPSGECVCSYVPFGDEYIDELLKRTNCSKYVLIVPATSKYQDSIVETYTTDDHLGSHEWYVLKM